MKKTAIFPMILALLLHLSGFCARAADIRMATKPMTEQYVLGSMVKQLIEHDTALTVDITAGVGGGTANIHPAMLKGDFDFYPEYTGTAWNMVLKRDNQYADAMFGQLQDAYRKMGMLWLGMTGFNNTFGLAVRKDIADRYNLKTYSDLAPVADKLSFGAEYDFYEREDGYDALRSMYNLNFKSTRDMDIGLKYEAIRRGQIDLMNIFTTDGRLSISDLTILEDDRHLYPAYVCGFVVRNELLEKYPQLLAVFAKMRGLISDGEMAEMNYQVEAGGKDPEDVAAAFLRKKRLLD